MRQTTAWQKDSWQCSSLCVISEYSNTRLRRTGKKKYMPGSADRLLAVRLLAVVLCTFIMCKPSFCKKTPGRLLVVVLYCHVDCYRPKFCRRTPSKRKPDSSYVYMCHLVCHIPSPSFSLKAVLPRYICNTKKHMGIIFFICAAENKILLWPVLAASVSLYDNFITGELCRWARWNITS